MFFEVQLFIDETILQSGDAAFKEILPIIENGVL